MPLKRRERTAVHLASATLIATAIVTSSIHSAQAQQAPASTAVSPTGKGITGGALLGAEVVMLTLGGIGIDTWWPYAAFGGAGAIAGGIGGYFLEGPTIPAEVPLYMLAGGMALVIPTLVVTLNATRYKPPEGELSEPIDNQPADEPPQPGASFQITTDAKPVLKKKHPKTEAKSVHVPIGLVDIAPDSLTLGVPAIEIRPLYSRAEMFQFGVAQGEEFRVPVIRAMF